MMPMQPMQAFSPMASRMAPGVRPSAPGAPMSAFAPAPPMAPAGMDAGMMQSMMPMQAILFGGRAHSTQQPHPAAVVAMLHQIVQQAMPEGSGEPEKALHLGTLIAGAGGFKGLRGHSLKRLVGCSSSPLGGPEAADTMRN